MVLRLVHYSIGKMDAANVKVVPKNFEFIYYALGGSKTQAAPLKHRIEAVMAVVRTTALGFDPHKRNISILIFIISQLKCSPIRQRQGVEILAIDNFRIFCRATSVRSPQRTRDRTGRSKVLKEQWKYSLGLTRYSDVNFGHLIHEALGKERESRSTEYNDSFGSVLPDEDSKGFEMGNERDEISSQRVEVSKGNADHIGLERIQCAHQAGPRERIEVKVQRLDLVLTADRSRQHGKA